MRYGNSSRGQEFNNSEDMAAFDRMSKASRDLLNCVPFPFSAQSVRSVFFRYDADEAAPMIEERVMQKCKQLTRDMGKNYPYDLPLIGWEKPPGIKSKRLHCRTRLTRMR